MAKITDKRGRVRGKKTRAPDRELYEDADTEQREGLATPAFPGGESTRDAWMGRSNAAETERPARLVGNRPQPQHGREES